jgi:hypothetical protein
MKIEIRKLLIELAGKNQKAAVGCAIVSMSWEEVA